MQQMGCRRLHESLAQELSLFGVKVCALELGGMRTNCSACANQDMPEPLPTMNLRRGRCQGLEIVLGKEISDPAKVAQVVLRLASSDHLPAHLLIGSDAVRSPPKPRKRGAAEGAQWRDVSLRQTWRLPRHYRPCALEGVASRRQVNGAMISPREFVRD